MKPMVRTHSAALRVCVLLGHQMRHLAGTYLTSSFKDCFTKTTSSLIAVKHQVEYICRKIFCFPFLSSCEKKLIRMSSLNLDSLVSWLSSRQYAPEGGFAGRTNKLVDGCYSHWAGGCWALVEATLPQPRRLWNAAALEEYILCCCQAKKGGLRDKPSK